MTNVLAIIGFCTVAYFCGKLFAKGFKTGKKEKNESKVVNFRNYYD